MKPAPMPTVGDVLRHKSACEAATRDRQEAEQILSRTPETHTYHAGRRLRARAMAEVEERAFEDARAAGVSVPAPVEGELTEAEAWEYAARLLGYDTHAEMLEVEAAARAAGGSAGGSDRSVSLPRFLT